MDRGGLGIPSPPSSFSSESLDLLVHTCLTQTQRSAEYITLCPKPTGSRHGAEWLHSTSMCRGIQWQPSLTNSAGGQGSPAKSCEGEFGKHVHWKPYPRVIHSMTAEGRSEQPHHGMMGWTVGTSTDRQGVSRRDKPRARGEERKRNKLVWLWPVSRRSRHAGRTTKLRGQDQTSNKPTSQETKPRRTSQPEV